MPSAKKASVLKWVKTRNTKQIFTTLAISMWTISFLMDAANKNYDPPEYVNPLIMLVGAYLFASKDDKEEKK